MFFNCGVTASFYWPEQTISNDGVIQPLENITTYNPSYNLNYDLKGIALTGNFDLKNKVIRVEKGLNN